MVKIRLPADKENLFHQTPTPKKPPKAPGSNMSIDSSTSMTKSDVKKTPVGRRRGLQKSTLLPTPNASTPILSTPAAAADSPLPPPPTPEPVKLNKVKSTTKKKYNLRGGRKVASTPKPKEKKIPAASVKKSSSAVAPAASAPPTPLNTTLNTSLSTSLSTSISATPGSGVLRFGENFEAFFLLADASSDDDAQRRKLGESIVSHDDPDCSSSSAAASSHTRVEEWQSLLVLTSKAVAALPAKAKKKSGRDLIKLHRRATTTLPKTFNDSRYAEIWISYARCQELYATPKEARMTYRYMKNNNLGTSLSSYYIFAASLEANDNNEPLARTILEDVLEIGNDDSFQDAGPSMPQEELSRISKALNEIEETGLVPPELLSLSPSIQSSPEVPPTASTPAATSTAFPTPPASLSPSLESLANSQPETPQVMQIHIDGDTEDSVVQFNLSSTKKGRPSNGDDTEDTAKVAAQTPLYKRSTPFVNKAAMSARSKRRMSIRRRLAASSPVNKKKNKKPLAAAESSDDDTDEMARHLERTANLLTRKHTPGMKTPNSSLRGSGTSSTPLSTLSLSSRLKATGMSGAKRVDASTASISEEDDSLSPPKDPANASKKNKKKTAKITKTDLAYMMSWDPTKKTPAAKSSKSSSNTNPRSSLRNNPTLEMDKIEEEPNGDDSNGSGASAEDPRRESSESNESDTKTLQMSKSTEKINDDTDDDDDADDDQNDTKNNPFKNLPPSPTSRLAKKMQASPPAPAAQTDLEANFTPLVKKSNMMHINGKPYAKLGVIGRGGSCKVYRVLAPDFSVLALKKVKLNGMDKKAIDSYANEIALLKSLQGNPAIIQINDSEVNLENKSIMIAMQMGDVDLNDVLKQQTSRGGNALNMNFIRLTWQQMLGAVHSIHEAKIIHGDLKPANFLFVKGALKLIDFGIARAIQTDDTTNIYRESQVGTLNYMSPEAILDSGTGTSGPKMRLGRASDVWSLGCILYQMCVGATPFAKLHMIPKLQAIVNPNHEIHYPETLDPAAVDAIQLCLRRTPGERPPIIGEEGLLNEHWFLHQDKT